MNLLTDPWIPVRDKNGSGAFQLATYRDILCGANPEWQLSLPQDDLEMACIHLLVCLTQVIFLPANDHELTQHISGPMSETLFMESVSPFLEWFDLDHPDHPFMQTRNIDTNDVFPIQKFMVGLPAGNNHAFFNAADEVVHMSAPIAAIALFNLAVNTPSMGGGFKASLRGNAAITTLIFNTDLRQMLWLNVLTKPRIDARGIHTGPTDKPTWVDPIVGNSTVYWNEIGLLRGLFWQPAHIEMLRETGSHRCDVIGVDHPEVYCLARRKRFNFSVSGLWPHPHGVIQKKMEKDKKTKNMALKEWFTGFTTIAPAWTHLNEFVIPRSINADVKEGSVPAEVVSQFTDTRTDALSLIIGGYRTNQASVMERRHEIIGLASSWSQDKNRLHSLVDIGKEARELLHSALYYAKKGNEKAGIKGLGVDVDSLSDSMFYNDTESLIHETLSNDATFREWGSARRQYVGRVSQICMDIFNHLTDPYAEMSDLILIVAIARRDLRVKLKKHMEENQ